MTTINAWYCPLIIPTSFSLTICLIDGLSQVDHIKLFKSTAHTIDYNSYTYIQFVFCSPASYLTQKTQFRILTMVGLPFFSLTRSPHTHTHSLLIISCPKSHSNCISFYRDVSDSEDLFDFRTFSTTYFRKSIVHMVFLHFMVFVRSGAK